MSRISTHAWRISALLALAVAAALGTAVATSHARKNGRIAFRRWFNDDQSWAPSSRSTPTGAANGRSRTLRRDER
jgi:hypothetical protein